MADEIRTARLVLRRARPADAAAMHAIMCDPKAMRYWSTLPHSTMAETESWMASMIDADPATSDDFIVTLGDELIGKLGAWKLPEIGFLFAPGHWRKGYALEAMIAFVDRRRRLGSAELTADVDPRNTASLKLLERVGFKECGRASGTFLVGDCLCDSIYLSLDL